MKKQFAAITLLLILFSTKAQITTSEVKVEQTNNVTTITGSAKFRGTERYSHFNYSTNEDTYIRGGKFSSNVLINDNGGNVGIGTQDPSRQLELYGNYPVLSLKNSADGTSSFGWLEFNDENSRMGFIGFGSAITNHLHIVNDLGGNVVIPNGNVGIGTRDPSRQLELYGDYPVLSLKNSADGTSSFGWLEFNDVNSRMGFIGFGSANTNHLHIVNDLGGNVIIPNGNVEILGGNVVIPNGNVGIGTQDPSRQLELYGDYPVLSLKNSADGTSSFGWLEFNDVNSRMGFIGFGSANTNHLHIVNDLGGNVIIPNGNVGIGTQNPSYTVDVNGSLNAHSLYNSGQQEWSDFVFEKDYQLLTLEEVERHINQKGHLPEVPGESEILEEGYDIGDMDAKLLQKIEELTLYLIEQNKRMNKLEAKNAELEKEVSILKTK